MSKTIIPIHNFSIDDASSIPFKLITLETRTGYDTSVPHRHNYYEIFIFEKGGGTHVVDFDDFGIEDRSVHFVSPGQVHKVVREPDSNGYIILFSRDFFYTDGMRQDNLFDLPFLNNNHPEPILNLDENGFNAIKDLVQGMEREYESEQNYTTEAINSYLHLLLLQSKRAFDQKKSIPQSTDGTYQKFKKALEENFQEVHSVTDYAELLSVTEKQLSGAVKKAVGKTALQMIHERIILESKRLLKHSDYSIKEIAYFLHFEDPSHFGKFFKNKVGSTPLEFRSDSVN